MIPFYIQYLRFNLVPLNYIIIFFQQKAGLKLNIRLQNDIKNNKNKKPIIMSNI